jgi:simple sugar transport system permease protein
MKVRINQIFNNYKYFLIIFLASIVSIIGISFLFSNNPLSTIYYFLLGPFLNIYSFGNMLNLASILMVASLGICLSFHIGFFNLGGEGQIYLGGFITTIFLLEFSNLNGFVGIFLSILCSIFVGGILAYISGLLKVKWNVNDLISTYLISRIVILFVNYLVTSVFNDENSNLLTTDKIDSNFFLYRILNPSQLNISFIIAIVLSIILYIYLNKTRFGYETIISGKNKEFSLYAGLPVSRYIMLSAFISGAFNSLAGSFAVLGTYHMTIKEFSSGLGFSAIAVSLIAKNNPLLIIFSSIFFAYIESGANSANINSDATIEFGMLIQSLIFITITIKVLPKSIKDIINRFGDRKNV